MFASEALVSRPMAVEPGWIDYNGHLNMAYYTVLFDRAADDGLAALGLGPDYAEAQRHTVYTAEVHVCYLRELKLGDEVKASFRLLDHDEKRLHVFQELRHAEGWLAATAETMSLHIDMSGPRVAPFLPDILARVEAMARAHAGLPVPDRAGRAIRIQRKS